MWKIDGKWEQWRDWEEDEEDGEKKEKKGRRRSTQEERIESRGRYIARKEARNE